MKKTSSKQKMILIISSVFLCIVLLELGLRIGGFVYLSLQEQKNIISLKQKGAYRIICLGESTTASGGKDSYPYQLEEILNQKNIGIKFSVINKGMHGVNSGVIVAQLGNNLNKYNPDMVIAMMGINDERDAVAYEDSSGVKIILFLKGFRIYKLANFYGYIL